MATSNKIDVSVILVTYNTKEMTSKCIDSIISHTQGVSYEIILVDNHSTDGSKEFYTNDKRVKYVYSGVNDGFGYGNNLGMHYAYGKYIFLLNTDTLLVNNAIKEFFDYAESHEPNTVYGCWLVDKQGNYACSYLNFPAFSISKFIKIHIQKINPISVDYKEKYVEVICGADMFIPRSVIEKSGGFDTNIFLHSEEIEYQYRMEKAKIKRKVIPQPKIVHFGGSSEINKSKSYLDSHFIMLKLHLPYWEYLLARVYYAIVYSLHSILKLKDKRNEDILRLAFKGIRLKKNATNVNLPVLD